VVSNLALDTQITGPWQGGPVEVRLEGASATLTNHSEQTINTFDLVSRRGAQTAQHLAVDLALAPGESRQAALSAPAAEAYVTYAVEAGGLTLRQIGVFVEDIVTNVIFVNLVDYGNHGLARLRIAARLKDTSNVYVVDVEERQSATVDLTLALTTYVENQILQFQLTKTPLTGDASITAWHDWDLGVQGNVVSITQELIA
jgi:hypothetical protein